MASLRLSQWIALAPYRVARFLARLVRLGSLGLLRLPRVYSYREKGTAAYIDGVFIHTLTGNWVRVRETSPGVFTQRAETPRPLAFGRGILPAPLICADDLAQVTAGTNDNYVYASNATWNTVRNAGTGTLAPVSDTVLSIGVVFGNRVYGIRRAVFPFDATGLPDDSDIILAHVHIYAGAVGLDGDTFHIVGPYAGSNPMVADDYDQIGSTSRGSLSITTTGAKIITLTDFTDISKTVVSLFGARGAGDLYNVAPDDNDAVNFYSADHATAEYRPALDVSYTAPPTKTATLKVAVYAQRTKTAALKLAVLAPARALLKVAVYAQPTKTTSAKVAVYAQRTKTAALKLALTAGSARTLLRIAVKTQPTVAASLRIAVTNLPWTHWAEDLKTATAWTEQPKVATIWTEQLKNTTTWTEQPKVTTAWAKQPKVATTWVEQLKGTTAWAKQPKVATTWTEQPKVTTVWTEQPKAATTWTPRSKGTTTWTRRSKGATTWTRRNPY